jgi:MFS family permease
MHRNLLLDVAASVGIGVTVAMVLTLLPTAARQGGMAPLGLAALAATPFAANLLGAFAGRIGARSVTQLAAFRALGAASLLLVVVSPTPETMIVVAFGYWLSISLPGPFHVRLWGQLYPAHARGRILALFGTGKAAATAVAALLGGLLADRLGAPAVFAIGGFIGLGCALAYAGLRTSEPPAIVRFGARESVHALLGRPLLRRVAAAHAFYGGGLIAALPLFALVHVDRLSLSLADVGVIGIVGAASTTLSYPGWGTATDRIGSLAVLRGGTSLGLVAIVAYALAPSVELLWLASAAVGAAGAATDTAVVALLSEETALDSRAAAMAGWNATTGAWGIAAPFTMTLLVQAGFVSVQVALLGCAVLATIGICLYLRAGAGERPGSVLPVGARVAEGLRSLRGAAAWR